MKRSRSYSFLSYYYPVQVVALVLDDLGDEAGELLTAELPGSVAVLDLDVPETLCFSGAVKGKAAFERLVLPGLFKDDRIVHHDVGLAYAYDYDPLSDAYHIRSHANAAVPVGRQRVPQILPHRHIILRRRDRLLPQEENVPNYLLDHGLICDAPCKNIT